MQNIAERKVLTIALIFNFRFADGFHMFEEDVVFFLIEIRDAGAFDGYRVASECCA